MIKYIDLLCKGACLLDNRPIGVFDSGLGGLTAVKELKKLLLNEKIIYFGDTGRVPYGTKSRETIIEYAKQDQTFLLNQNVKLIIAACGTVSSVAGCLEKHLPVPYVEVVTPSAEEAVKLTKNKKIGVIGTNATINSGSYAKRIKELDSSCEIFSNSCPLLVPLVESGWIDRKDSVTVEAVQRYLKPLIKNNIDTLILGCTHYPILKNIINDVCNGNVSLISPGEQAAIKAKNYLEKNNMLNSEKPFYKYFVSDKTESFVDVANIFLGEDLSGKVKQIDITEFR